MFYTLRRLYKLGCLREKMNVPAEVIQSQGNHNVKWHNDGHTIDSSQLFFHLKHEKQRERKEKTDK